MSKFPWKTTLAVSALVAATAYAFAQMSPDGPMGMHGQMQQGGIMHKMHQQMMQGQGGMRGGMGGRNGMHEAQSGATGTPTMPGQDAFGAIQEIVGILEADPKTDWSKVNIEALRQHLIDMNNVTLAAEVASSPIEGGMRYTVTGAGAVQESIRRMVTAHAATMDGVDGWHFEAATTDGGAVLTVRPPAKDMEKLRGLGFIGVLTRGMRHQMHHLMIARGENPHE